MEQQWQSILTHRHSRASSDGESYCSAKQARRSLAKFRDAVHEDVGSRLTMVSAEEILLESPRAPGMQTCTNIYIACMYNVGMKPEETKVAGDPLALMGKGGAVLMVCGTCGKKASVLEALSTASGVTKEAYVPLSKRAGTERSGADMRQRNEENFVRVTNLSEDTRKADLVELFSPFGPVSQVCVPFGQTSSFLSLWRRFN
ncbi:unnamed protein product [Ilex paraguariensis]|uniref:RRM domain-containing protein n=1 Tax=Ilex paraguariensis TaxID=185542 RepID=A0ABC8V3E9_9AQUA